MVMSAILVKEKEGSSADAPVSVCYRFVKMNPKFTGLAAALNRIVAKSTAKLSVAPMIRTKEQVEKILAEYNPGAEPVVIVPLPEAVFKGFNHYGTYNPALHTAADRAKTAEAVELAKTWWSQCNEPGEAWKELSQPDGSQFELGLQAYSVYDAKDRCGKAIAHCYMDATPSQVMAWYVMGLEGARAKPSAEKMLAAGKLWGCRGETPEPPLGLRGCTGSLCSQMC